MTRCKGTNPGERVLAHERFRVPTPAIAPAPEPRQPRELVPAVMKSFGLENLFLEHELLDAWPELVGPQVARHTRPGGIAHGTVTVFVRHSTWLQELSRYGQNVLIERLRSRFGAHRIRRLRLQLDPEPPTGA